MDIVNAIKLVLEQFTNETVNISLTVLLFLSFVLIAYWYYNRRKFHQLRHQIPASVVKNYLDSIIANSNALKSSLFRGGGLELGEGVPSILPTTDLPLGGVSSSSDQSEELAQKNAEIANLKAIVNQKNVTIAELEKMLASAKANSGAVGMSDEESDILKNEISTLKGQLEEANNLLENANSNSGGDEEIIKERDELKERLMEYEIIEEDLANLKRYQQENEELKKTIESLKSSEESPAMTTEAVVEEPAAEVAEAEEPVAEIAEAEEPVAEAEEPVAEPAAEAVAAAEPVEDKTPEATGEEPAVPQNEGEQKSAEELLSEFEKMLG
jgi:hypothetical protein